LICRAELAGPLLGAVADVVDPAELAGDPDNAEDSAANVAGRPDQPPPAGPTDADRRRRSPSVGD
jgi:hypothetical protein